MLQWPFASNFIQTELVKTFLISWRMFAKLRYTSNSKSIVKALINLPHYMLQFRFYIWKGICKYIFLNYTDHFLLLTVSTYKRQITKILSFYSSNFSKESSNVLCHITISFDLVVRIFIVAESLYDEFSFFIYF